ncbi:MAG: S-layer homology domain-containing protein [Oscillatoriales cyanobacterium C42_A2020_001]|nr:S-layer homology domain-containing protein [Leptolyngbyaceae cyanobacterium C42_A2020_001]
MSNSVPPDQRPPRLRDDEPIALLVTLLAFGAIFWWALSQGRPGWDFSSFLPGVASSPTPTATPFPLPTTTPTIAPSPTIQNEVQGTVQEEGTVVVPPSSSPVPATGAIATPQPTVSPSPITGQTGVVPASPIPTRPVPAPTVSGTPIAFADVPSNYWAYPFIAALSARGIIGGFPDGQFKPNEPVTRAQFAVQLQKAFTKPDRLPPKPFTDVPPGSQWSNAVDKAVKGNFMSGYPEGDFRPEQQVSRVEAIASMARGLGLDEPADPEAILQAYQDRNQIPAWARGRMAAAIQAGIFSGDRDTQLLNPNQAATRADIAALVYKGLELSGSVPKLPPS